MACSFGQCPPSKAWLRLPPAACSCARLRQPNVQELLHQAVHYIISPISQVHCTLLRFQDGPRRAVRPASEVSTSTQLWAVPWALLNGGRPERTITPSCLPSRPSCLLFTL